jgi:hypothetical protein
LVADLEADARDQYVSSFVLAWVYASVGRTEDAFAALERALSERDRTLLWAEAISHSPLRKLENDPRWDNLIKRIGIPPQ